MYRTNLQICELTRRALSSVIVFPARVNSATRTIAAKTIQKGNSDNSIPSFSCGWHAERIGPNFWELAEEIWSSLITLVLDVIISGFYTNGRKRRAGIWVRQKKMDYPIKSWWFEKSGSKTYTKFIEICRTDLELTYCGVSPANIWRIWRG